MSNKTTIGWTQNPDGSKGRTWNPTTGCDRVSPGCDNCYALAQAGRNKAMHSPAYQVDGNPKTSGPGFALQMHDDRVEDPFGWPAPTRVFVNSMSDLFHGKVTEEFIARVFAVMALTPQHTYQILTKRHDRMRAMLNRYDFWTKVLAEAIELSGDDGEALLRRSWVGAMQPDGKYALVNVWLGVSVEDQRTANLRIPELIDTPAAVRFLSCEPLLAPVNIAPLLPPVVRVQPEDAPPVWSEWTWDAWVPDAVRAAVEDFWPADHGGPQAWLRDALDNGSHAYGQAVRSFADGILPPQRGIGKWVHARGNVGRLVHPDGSHSFVSFTSDEVRRQRHIDWVIVGGESGRRPSNLRPLHPEWARTLHKQTEAGGAAFYMKQLGTLLAKEWGATGKGEDPAEWQVPFPQNFPDAPVLPELPEPEATIETGATA